MFQIDPLSRTPVYEQIIEQVQRLITAGVLRPGDQIPSVRGLSLTLRINPNTIQKAYSELDGAGLITSVPGKGCFVCSDAPERLRACALARLPEWQNLTRALLQAGMEEEALIEALRKIGDESDLRKESPS